MVILIFVSVLVGLATAFWWIFERPYSRIKRMTNKLPGPPSVPLFENSYLVSRYKDGFWGLLKDQIKYGKLSKLRLPGLMMVVVSDPKDVEIVLRGSENLEKPYSFVSAMSKWLGKGLVFAEANKWRENRKLIQPAFHYNILEKFLDVFNDHSNDFVQFLREKADGKTNVDISPLLQYCTLDIINETAMGTKLNTLRSNVNADYANAIKRMCGIVFEKQQLFTTVAPFLYRFTDLCKEEDRCLKIIKDFSNKVIQEKKKELIESNLKQGENLEDNFGSKKRMAFLDLLLQARRSNGEPFTDQEISDEVETFMFGGHDTTATQLGLIFYHFSRNPHVQEEIFKEQCDILGDEDRDPTFKEVQDMNYLERAIKESQRTHTSIPIYSRELSHDVKLHTDNFVVPKGASISIYAHNIHHNPDIYPNPDRFDPDNFLPEKVRERSLYSFVPMSAGPRSCIGSKFAMIEMKVLMAKICRNFKILSGVDENGKLLEMNLEYHLLLVSTNGIHVRLLPRQK